MLQGIFDGVFSYLRAFQLIAKHRLWAYFFAPILIGLILGGAIFRTAWTIADDIGGWLIRFYPWEWGKDWLLKIAEIFGGVFVAAIGLILFKHLVMALSSPVMSFLSETIERKITGHGGAPPFSIRQMLSDMARGIRIAIRNIIRELFYTLLLFLLGIFIPLFSPIIPFAIFFVQSYYAGFGNIDFTLERHFRVRESVQFVRRHRGLALGNGIVFMGMLLTVVGFLFALPLGTVAAATQTIKRLGKEGTGSERIKG